MKFPEMPKNWWNNEPVDHLKIKEDPESGGVSVVVTVGVGTLIAVTLARRCAAWVQGLWT